VFLTHPCQGFIDPHNSCGSSWPGIPSYPVTLLLHSTDRNRSFSRIPIRCHARCCEMLTMGCLPSSSPVSPHHVQVSLEMHLQAIIVLGWRYTWRPYLCEIRDTLGGSVVAGLEMHLAAVIERVWRCTWRPWSTRMGGVLGGGQAGGGSLGRRRDGSWDSIQWLTRDCCNVENWVQNGLPREERLAGSGRQSIWGWCSMLCMLYSVYAVLGVCCTWCMLYSRLTHYHGMEN